jgi:hypothetical protein
VEPHLGRVEKVYLAGGEPLLMEEHDLILDRLIELKRTDVALAYNTNLSALDHHGRNVLDLWSRFSNVTVAASLDGSGSRGEYIRKGLVWKQAVANCLRIRRELPHVKLRVTFTLSLLNAMHLADFHRECVELGMIETGEMDLNLVLDPRYLCITCLPAGLKDHVRARFERRSRELRSEARGCPMPARFDSALEFMDSADDSERLDEFRRHTCELDAKRGERFSEVFPELDSLGV